MVQIEDTKTLPLPLEVVTEKRGPGRPRKEVTLTGAQRQAAYRARHGKSSHSVTVTKNIPFASDGYDELVVEGDRLRHELRCARDEINRLKIEVAGLKSSAQRSTSSGTVQAYPFFIELLELACKSKRSRSWRSELLESGSLAWLHSFLDPKLFRRLVAALSNE